MASKWTAILVACIALNVATAAWAVSPVPDKVGPFVTYCTTHFADCKNEVVTVDVATMAGILFAKNGTPTCVIPKGVNNDTGTKEILAWLGKTKNTYAMKTEAGIRAAEKALWHCQVQIGDGSEPGGPPAKTGAFVVYCPTHSVKCANEMVVASVTIMVPDRPKHCLPPETLKNEEVSAAVLGWLARHKETYGLDTVDGIVVAFDHLWPCRLGVNLPAGKTAPTTEDAKEPVPQKGSLAAEVLEKLKATREYKTLSSYYDEKKKSDPAWLASAQGRAVDAYLATLRSDAAATRAVDTGKAKYLEYAVDGVKVTDKGVSPLDLKIDKEYRDFIASAVATNIVTDEKFKTFLATLEKGAGSRR